MKPKAYAIVFNSDGMPKIKDPRSVPLEVWGQLTDEQKDFANSKVPENLRRKK